MARNPSQDVPPEILEEDEDEAAVESGLAESNSDVDFDLEANPGLVARGSDVIRRFWTTLPNRPGVYRMLDAKGEVLYVGKARNLKARVAAYTRGLGHSNRIARVIAETAAMECVTTATETEALLLEANLIKQLRPRYNVLLRDDKSFPYILLTADHEAPQIVKHRGARKRPGDYFGPFASVWAVNRTINALQRAFLLRSCNDSYYQNRTRPCLLYQIKRCSGPCTKEISSADYQELVAEARGFLAGKSSAVKERITTEMHQAAEALEYERAARYRDRLAALSAIQGIQGINTQSVEEADVFAIDEQAGQFCVEVFFFRNWQNWGNRAYFPKAHKSLSKGEVLEAFVAQFYDDKPPPRLILLSDEIEEPELLAAALSTRAKVKVDLHVPQRGERRQLLDYALRNAKEALGRRLAETASQSKLLTSLSQAFVLNKRLRRVEVYDNSHILGTNAVGAMIVAGEGGLMKQHYRTFLMRSEELVPGDDYGMMREMLRRRFTRLMKEAPLPPIEEDATGETQTSDDEFPAWPDLVLIDGGQGQLEAARQALIEAGADKIGVTLIGIAKGRDRDAGRETFFKVGAPPFRLPPRDPALYFVQRLRDEAHRFAIGAHRARRKREMTKSPLDEIPGIGPTRKRALLHHFGTIKAIQRAALPDLMKAPGVNAAMARVIYDFFHG